jgi:hypothetical protein
MQPGKRLCELQDDLEPAGTLDSVVVNFGGYPVVLNAYAYILGVLGAGDSESTDKTVQFDQNGNLTTVETAPGDSMVLRSSALMDERIPANRSTCPISPIKWNQVIFLFSDHRDITRDPEFTDNLLYILLESP